MKNEKDLKTFFRPTLPVTLSVRVTLREKMQISRMARRHKVSRSEILRAGVIRLINNNQNEAV